jgi:hypothetical protein
MEVKMRKQFFWVGLVLGGLGFFLLILGEGPFEVLFPSLGVGLFFIGIVGYIIGAAIDARKHPKENKQSEMKQAGWDTPPSCCFNLFSEPD